ncbi:MAG TPA: 2Fe-2S iron-sulfur cluster-binding protein, partial [Chitinophagaceae bacterium]|nr:2Fe-2S iron-sulfur cluster-binding protein [Chitinophagaceae bacterium]
MIGERKKLRITGIIQETRQSKSFVLETLDGSEITYKPGQFLTFIFDTPFGEERRNYSFSSSPDWQEPVRITIKRIENGYFSRKLVDAAQVGDVLTTIGASGFFTLPDNIGQYQQLFLLAAGSGITPVFSILKTVLRRFPGVRVILIFSNHSKEDTIFYKPLQQLQQQYPEQLQIEWLFSNVFDYTKSRLSNWLLGELLKKYIAAPLAACLFYLCGPFDYMRMITIALLSAGINSTSIRKEEFVITQPRVVLAPPDTKKRQVTVVLNKNQYRFSSMYPQTILQAAKKVGIELPFSCETGRCGTCAAVCMA